MRNQPEKRVVISRRVNRNRAASGLSLARDPTY